MAAHQAASTRILLSALPDIHLILRSENHNRQGAAVCRDPTAKAVIFA